MVVLKHDTVVNELFIKSIRGLYKDQTISVEEFKERNATLMKNRWIDTQHGSSGEKIYELYDPNQEGELIKESLQAWLCDNQNEITQCIGIALRNHEKSYAEWFRYVDSRSGPDELALYSLSRKYGIQTAIYNKSYLWTTLADHVLRNDQEIYSLCGVKLVFLDETTYGIIKDIRVPNPDERPQSTPTSAVGHKKPAKKTCRESGRGRTGKKSEPKPKREKRSKMLSESRQVTFGIVPPPAVTRSVRSNRQNIDYLTLNDGLEDDEVSSPKRRRRTTYRPHSGPSATRHAARKHTASPELQGVTMTGASSTLPAVPPPASKPVQSDELTGVPNKTDDNILPDLVLKQEDPDTTQAVSTEEEMDVAAVLLSLGEIKDDTLDDNNKNAELMPIRGPNVPLDIAPQPIRLDQLSVNNAIAEMIQVDDQSKDTPANTKTEEQVDVQAVAVSVDANNDNTIANKNKQELATKGTLQTKTYTLKKKTGTKRRSFKCSECDVIKKSIRELNIHHEECHNPQICGICGKLFKLASSLTRHMYEHNQPKYHCDQCNYNCQFKSELQMHKIVHRKNPSYKCMKASCGKWFKRKWDLTLHLQKHNGVCHDCEYEGCQFSTDTKKQLKEHQKSHQDDYQHVCATCGKGFKYRSGLKRHRDKDH